MAFDGSSFGGGGLFSRPLQLALTGQLQEYIAQADQVVMKAARAAVDSVTTRTKDRLRDMVVKAGLGREGAGSGKGSGRSLASAIRGDVYPGKGLSHQPAGWVFIQPSAVRIYEAFETGATVRSGGGKYLTIPVPGSPADRKIFGDKPRGSTVLEALKSRGVKLSFVPGKGDRPAMLIGENVRVGVSKSGRTRISGAKAGKSGRYGKGAEVVPLFWLVPQAKLPRKFDFTSEFKRAAEAFMAEFAKAFAAELARLQAAQA